MNEYNLQVMEKNYQYDFQNLRRELQNKINQRDDRIQELEV